MALADTLNRRTLGSLHEDPASPRKHIDVGLLVVTGLISVIGLALIYSARHRRLTDAGLDPFYYVKRQGFALVRRFDRPRDRRVDRLPKAQRVGALSLRREQRGAAPGRVTTRLEIERQPGVVPGRVVPDATFRVRQDHVDRRARRVRGVRQRSPRSTASRHRPRHRAGACRADHVAARPGERAGARRDHDGHASRRRAHASVTSSFSRCSGCSASLRSCRPTRSSSTSATG